MTTLRLAPDVLVEPLDDADTAVFVAARAESHVVDLIGSMLLSRLVAGPATDDELLALLQEHGVADDRAGAAQYLAALLALWRGAGILAT